MASINKVILVGRLGQDPQRKMTSAGKEFSTFSMATSRRVKEQEITAWHNVVCWNESNANYVNSYAQKGSLVYIEGQLEPRTYDKDGVTHYTYDVVIPGYGGSVQILKDGVPRGEERSRGNGNEYEQQTSGAGGGGRRRPAKEETAEERWARERLERDAQELDDEIPF